MEETLVTEVTGVLTDVAGNITEVIGAIAPIALGIVEFSSLEIWNEVLKSLSK